MALHGCTMTQGLLNKIVSAFACGICLFDSIPEKHNNWKKTQWGSPGPRVAVGVTAGGRSPGDVGC